VSKTFQRVVELVAQEEVRISAHGYDELAVDDIYVEDVIDSLPQGEVIEDHPNFPKALAALFYRWIQEVTHCTSFGVYRMTLIHRPY
jgi:hypothetical protein